MPSFDSDRIYETLQLNATESSDPVVHQVADILNHEAIASGTRLELPLRADYLDIISKAIGVDESTANKQAETVSVMLTRPFSGTRSIRGRYVEFFNEIGPTNGLIPLQAEEWIDPKGYKSLSSHISVATMGNDRNEHDELLIDDNQPVVSLSINAIYDATQRKAFATLYKTLLPYGEQDSGRFTRNDTLEQPAKALVRYLRTADASMPTVPIASASISVGPRVSGPWYMSYTGATERQTFRLNTHEEFVVKE